MPSKLGPHCLTSSDEARAMVAAGARLIKVVSDYGMALDLSRQFPDLLIIGREYNPVTAEAQHAEGLSPEDAARKFVNDQSNVYTTQPHIKIWEGHNEPVWGSMEEVGWYARFDVERMRLMAERGLRCVIGNFATGNPGEMNFWKAYLPAMQAAKQYNAILGLHEYSSPWMWFMVGKYQLNPGPDSDEGWVTLRYRKVYRQFFIPAGCGDVPLVITECGLDRVAPVPPGASSGNWRSHAGWWSGQDGQNDPIDYWRGGERDAERYYAEQLMWYDRELRKDAFVIGATVFTVGSFDGTPWKDYDIVGTRAAKYLIDYIRQEKDKPDLTRPLGDQLQPASADGAKFVTDVTVPDNTVMAPGAPFIKTWRIRNAGQTTWDSAYKLAFVGGDQMGGMPIVPITRPVPPGAQADVSVNLIPPAANGTYTGKWQMKNGKGEAFGNRVTVVINVVGAIVPVTPPTPFTPAPPPRPAAPVTPPTPPPAPVAPPPAPVAPPPSASPPVGGREGGTPVGVNLLQNGTFEQGAYDLAGAEVPNNWLLWFADDRTPKLPKQDQPWFKPEAKVWSVSDAPAWDKDAFLRRDVPPERLYCWKVWGAWRPIWCALRQKVTGLTPNIKYRFTVPVHPDLVIDEQGGGKQYAPDLLSGEARLVATFAGQSVDTGWKDGTQMPFGKYTSLTFEFTPTTTEVTVAVEFRGRWGIEHNGWFFDSFTLEALPSAQSQPQPRAAQPSATQPRPLPPQPPQPLPPQPLAPQPPRPQPLASQPKLLPQIVPGGAGMSVPQPLPSRPQPIPPRPQPKPLPTQPQPVAPPRPQPAQSPVAPQPQAQPPAPAPRQPPPVPPDVKLENVTIKNRLFDYSLDGWETWAVVREGRCERQRPNFESYRSPVPPFRVLISHTALRISIEAGKSYEAGVYQRVSGITPGTPLRYVAQGHTWSSTGDDPFRSEGADRATMKVGIDPFGGADPMAGTVVWSNPVDSFDEYREIEVRTVAMNETITLFLYAHPTACVKHNESFWDDNRLYSTGPAIAIPPESPAPVTPAPQPPPVVPAPVPASRPSAGGEAVGDNPTGANLLRNGDFDGGYYNTAPELAIPNEWDLWFAEQMTPKLPRQDTPFLKPETVVWNIKDAPEWEKSQFFLSGNFCWKVFGAWKPIWVRLSQRVTGLTPGSPYRFTVPFHPDLVNSYEKDGKHYAPDLLSGEHRLSATFAGTTVETGWKDGHDVPFGKYTRLSLDFTPTTSEVTVALEFRGRWGLANCGWFVDSASLQMLSGSGGTVTAAAMPSFTPAPVAPAPVTPAPARPPASSPSGGIEGGRGVTGKLDLIDNKPTYAARSDAFPGERIRVRETIVNNTNQPISYGVLGVKATAVGGGQDAFQTSWSGNLSIGPGQTGPDNGRPWEDGLFLAAGVYNLTLSICYSSVDDCLGGKGRWEELTPPVTVKVINWTP